MATDTPRSADYGRRTITTADKGRAVYLALQKAAAKVRITRGQREHITGRRHNDGPGGGP